ncbi:hypothetical protein JVT61DRAFT_7435 [Boletus reticuloceps]|uniref:Uncharacterized protein n=1 Tax=Boletus reticuloceps TaxID=495285 RepID=A0A8I2YIV0_9AGAM|nr:hypothetical protein JVT61DRAFT_7435 [Boletus reticuloceps]
MFLQYSNPWNAHSNAINRLHCNAVYSHTVLLTDLELFYNSILELIDDLEKKEEVELQLQWWNRQIFLTNAESSQLPSN